MSKLLKYLAFFALLAGMAACEEKKEPKEEPEQEYVFVKMELERIRHELNLLQMDIRFTNTGLAALRNAESEYSRILWANYTLDNIRDSEKGIRECLTRIDSLISKINNPNVKKYLP